MGKDSKDSKDKKKEGGKGKGTFAKKAAPSFKKKIATDGAPREKGSGAGKDGVFKKDFSKKKGGDGDAGKPFDRATLRPHHDLVVELKVLWNALRLKKNTPAETSALAAQLAAKLKGKCLDIARKHDASRVVQALVQFGSQAQRAAVLAELAPALPELAKSQYSHFIVLKLVKYLAPDAEGRSKILQAIKGHVVKLGTHSVGARVIEVLFSEFPGRETLPLRREFYGKSFGIFGDEGVIVNAAAKGGAAKAASSEEGDGDNAGETGDSTDLYPLLLSSSLGAGGSGLLAHLLDVLNKAIAKDLLPFHYVHSLLNSYVAHAEPKDVRDLSTTSAKLLDSCPLLLTSRAGSLALCQLLGVASAKDRKRAMKSMKGYVTDSVLNARANVTLSHLPFVRLCEVVDDTVTMQKMILQELLVSAAEGPTLRNADGSLKGSEGSKGDGDDDEDGSSAAAAGKKRKATAAPAKASAAASQDGKQSHPLRAYALHAMGAKLLLNILSDDALPSAKIFEPRELAALQPVLIDGEATSKKGTLSRRQEVRQFLKASILDMCAEGGDGGVAELMESITGGRVLLSAATALEGGVAVRAAEAAVASFKAGGVGGGLFEHPVGHLTLKSFLKAEKEGRLGGVSEALVDKLGSKGVVEVALGSSRGAFVVEALLESGKAGAVKKMFGDAEKKKLKTKAGGKGGEESGKGKGWEALAKKL